jgi:hypothetical protein
MAPLPLPLQPGSVAVESPASGPLHHLITELVEAETQWENLGVRIAMGYTAAYASHVKTLSDMGKAKLEASTNALQFVFSAVCVGLAGGAVGGLMGPWIKQAAESTAHFVFKESVRSIAQQGAKDLAKVLDEKLKPPKREAADEPYTTNSPKEIAVDLDIRNRILTGFTAVYGGIDAMIARANKDSASEAVGQAVLSSFRQSCPLLTDKPGIDDMPSPTDAQRAAELAMWVAWANERDWNWWTKVYERLDASDRKIGASVRERDGTLGVVNEIAAASEMDPIGRRMVWLKKWGEVENTSASSFGPRSDVDRVTYTDLRKLRALKITDPSLPFHRMSGLSFKWDKTNPLQRMEFLSKFQSLRPVYKKP